MRLSVLLPLLLLACTATAQIDPNPRPAAPKPKPAAGASATTIKVYSSIPCRFYVDGELKGTITDERPLRVALLPGEYMFMAVSTADARDEVRDTYTVYKGGDDGGSIYHLGLQAVVERRLGNERWENDRIQAERAAVEKEAKEKADREAAFAAVLAKLENDMVRIEGGSYMMGAGCPYADCQPAHRVSVSTFLLNKFEVTFELWVAVMGSGGLTGHRAAACPQCPVSMESWENVHEFIRKLNALTGKKYRLPTEAEWEYAARGGTHSRGYRFAGSNDLDSVGWYPDNRTKIKDGWGGYSADVVGQKKPNELGLYDMSGGAQEWCSDWYDRTYYKRSPAVDPQGPSSGHGRVVRGGSYNHSFPCLIYVRDPSVGVRPKYRTANEFAGLRLARTE